MMNKKEAAVQQLIEEEEMASNDVAPMSDAELVSVCTQEISQGLGGENGSDNQEISLPLEYYNARLPGISARKARDRDSSVYVSDDLRSAVESTMAEIMPLFQTNELGVFDPVSEEDVEQAEVETALSNHLFFTEYSGYLILQELVKDALLNRNCTAKVYWDERGEVSYEELDGIPAMAIPQVLQPQQENESVELVEQEVDGQVEIPPMIDPITGMPADMGQVIETYRVKIKRIKMIGKPVIESIAPENLVVGSDHHSPVLFDARFVAHSKVETASSLIAQGFDPEVVKKLPDYNSGQESSYARSNSDYGSVDDSTMLIQVYECFINIDFDGDGLAERRKVVIAGDDTLLSNDVCDHTPLVGGVGTIMPHAYEGVSLFDRLKGIQDVKTNLIRSVIDSTALSANPRIGVVTGEANLDDILSSSTGGIVRVTNPGAAFQFPNPEVGQSSYSLLSMMDAQRQERGGSAISTANAAQSVSGDSAHGIERVMSAMELANTLIARTIAETVVKGIFITLHAVIKANMKSPVNARIGGKWVNSTPAEWKDRPVVRVQMGNSHAKNQQMAGVMNQIAQVQGMLAQAGSVLFSEEKQYDALTDGAKYSGVTTPERYYVDITSPEGQQAKQQQTQQKQQEKQKMDEAQQTMMQGQQMLAQAEMLKGQADMQANQVKVQNEQLKAEIQGLKELANANQKSAELEFDYAKLYLDNQLKKEENESKQALELTKLELEAGRDLNAEMESNEIV
jgi:hypothetical protein